MAQVTAIYSLEDLYQQRYAPLSTLDLTRVSATVKAYAQFLADDMANQLDLFTDEIVKSRAIWGGAPTMAFDEVGEFGKGTPRRELTGQELHFPLFKLDATQAASEEFWRRASVADLVDVMNAMDSGYATRVRQEIAAAIFNTGTHTPVVDWLVDKSNLNKIQPFLNADSAAIPTAPNGKTFTASTHTHYLGITGSTVATSDVNYLVNHVQEHVLGKIVLFVDPAMPATLAGLASTKYVARQPVVYINQSTTNIARESFDPNADRANMSVGYWDGFEVVTRSWVPTNYICAMAVSGQLGKPLLRRIDPSFPGLRVAQEISDGIMRIKESYFYMGVSVFNRAAGAVLDCATGSNAYAIPSGLVRS